MFNFCSKSSLEDFLNEFFSGWHHFLVPRGNLMSSECYQVSKCFFVSLLIELSLKHNMNCASFSIYKWHALCVSWWGLLFVFLNRKWGINTFTPVQNTGEKCELDNSWTYLQFFLNKWHKSEHWKVKNK